MFRNTASLCAIALTATLAAHADFSFSKTQKVTGGSMAAMAGNAANRESKSYFKGQKAAEVSNDSTILMDFDAQTITTINKVQKTYQVQKFGDLAAAAGGANADMSVDVKETGQTKTINGYNAKESLVTLNLDFAVGRGPAMKMAAEIEVWRSTEIPGAAEMRAFYQKNANNFPWAAMMGAGGNQSIQRAITQVQKKLAESDGMVVEEVIRIKPAGAAGPQAGQAPPMPLLTPEQQAKMQAARAQMEAMSKQGGAQAAAAQQAMAAMAAMGRGPATAGGAASALIELTIDNTGFSTEAVPDSEFVVPSDYKQIP
jgi:hypothetical protein